VTGGIWLLSYPNGSEVLLARTTAAVRCCMAAGVALPGAPATVALDLRTAVLSPRINEPDLPWPLAEQAERFLAKFVGLTPADRPPDRVR
jgi:hypothetical protein